jgi:trigger factor
MKTEMIKNENSVAQVKVSANSEAWKSAVESEYKKAGENVEIDGFRKGKAPMAKIKQSVNKFDVLSKAADTLLNDLYKFALTEHSLEPVSQPKLDFNKIDDDALEVLFDIAIKPDFKLGEYKGLSATKEDVVVSDEEVDNQINALLEQHVNLEVADKVIENGDTAVIDFEGFKEDVAFEGGKGESYPLEIGSGSFIPGFEEALVGHKTGDELDVNVTFPEQYQSADLAGQPVVFKVKVHEVKAKVANELNDEFAASLGKENVTTVAELKEDMLNEIKKQKEAQADSKYLNDLVDQILENTEITLPQMMIESETEAMYNDFLNRLQQQGMNEEMYLQMLQKTKEEICKEMEVDAEKRIKYTLILEEIANVENIEVSDAELDEKLEEMAKMYNMEVEQIKQFMPDLEGLRFETKMGKAIDIIKENAK